MNQRTQTWEKNDIIIQNSRTTHVVVTKSSHIRNAATWLKMASELSGLSLSLLCVGLDGRRVCWKLFSPRLASSSFAFLSSEFLTKSSCNSTVLPVEGPLDKLALLWSNSESVTELELSLSFVMSCVTSEAVSTSDTDEFTLPAACSCLPCETTWQPIDWGNPITLLRHAVDTCR